MIAAVDARPSTEGRGDTMRTADRPAETAAEKPARRPRQRGQGSLYQRGSVWWVQYFVNGRRVRESAETSNRRAAQDFLNGKLGHVAEGKPILPRVDRIRYDELAADLRRHYETTGARDLVEADKRLEPLKAFFTGARASGIGTADVTTLRRAAPGGGPRQRHDQPRARDARASVAVRYAAGSPETRSGSP